MVKDAQHNLVYIVCKKGFHIKKVTKSGNVRRYSQIECASALLPAFSKSGLNVNLV
jgi:hypothetical protein